MFMKLENKIVELIYLTYLRIFLLFIIVSTPYYFNLYLCAKININDNNIKIKLRVDAPNSMR